MSEIIRSLLPRLASRAISEDFVDRRRIADLIEEQSGSPREPTAMAQLRLMAEGRPPSSMINSLQLDRG
jgi:hypothetical protein